MFNPDAKPRRNPSTGCAHITNYEHPAFGFRRCCSYCYAPQPKDIDEELLKTCYSCGETFDHAEDDLKEDADSYD